jgi:hypothetical protein
MKYAAVAFVLLGLLAGCARQSSSSSPSASPGSYTSRSACERAGYTWDSSSGVCK